MTSVAHALKSAGVRLPTVKYRIWNWLRDHSEKTADDVQTALGLTYNPAQSLVEMERGGVLKAYSDVSRKAGLHGVEYRVKRYSVTDAKEYRNTPYRPKETKSKPLRKATQAVTKYPLAPPPVFVRDAARTVVFNAEAYANALTLMQARAVYNHLKEVFA